MVGLDTIPPTYPTSTPSPTPTATPRVTATPTPIPTNSMGLPEVGDSGLVVSHNDPNYEKISQYYLYGRLWTDESPVNASESNTKFDQKWEWKTPTLVDGDNNKDILGWVYMEFYGKTNKDKSDDYKPQIGVDSKPWYIDEPIMYDVYSYYFDHKVYGQSSDGGSLMVYFNSVKKNIVVTGHNSRTVSRRSHFYHLHTMQNGLKYYIQQGAIASDDYIFNITIFGRSHWQVWAIYETTSTESDDTLVYNTHPSCGDDAQAWINYQLGRSEVPMGVSVSADDQFLTFYTCGDVFENEEDEDTTQARLYVFLKYVGDD